jgi:hypothetical protein
MLIVEIDNFAHHLATILQYFKQEADSRKVGAVLPMDALSDMMSSKGIDVNPDIIKSLMDDPVIKNLVKSFDGEKITIDTVVEPTGDDAMDINGSDEVSKMAKRALRKRSK